MDCWSNRIWNISFGIILIFKGPIFPYITKRKLKDKFLKAAFNKIYLWQKKWSLLCEQTPLNPEKLFINLNKLSVFHFF